VHDAADLGRQHVLIAGFLAQRRAHAQFAAAITVERRRIEVADAALIGGIDQISRFGVGDRRAKAAQRGAAEAEFGNIEFCGADLASVERCHRVLSRGSRCHRVCRSTQPPTIAKFRDVGDRPTTPSVRSGNYHLCLKYRRSE
jgi:hypothetical protein